MAQHPGEPMSGKTVSFEKHPVDMNIPGIHEFAREQAGKDYCSRTGKRFLHVKNSRQ